MDAQRRTPSDTDRNMKIDFAYLVSRQIDATAKATLKGKRQITRSLYLNLIFS